MPLHTVALQLVQSNACSSPAQAETTLYVRRALGATYPMTASVHRAGAAPTRPDMPSTSVRVGAAAPPPAAAAAAGQQGRRRPGQRARLRRRRRRWRPRGRAWRSAACPDPPACAPSCPARAPARLGAPAGARQPAWRRRACPAPTASAACLAHAHNQQLNQPPVAQGWKHLYRATSAAPTAASAHAQTAHIDGMAALAVVVAADVAHGPPSSFAVVIHSLRMHVSPLSPTRQRNRQSR